MNRIHSNSDSAAGVTALTHHHLSNVSCVSSGSLGKRQHRVNSTFGDGNATSLLSGKISLQEASNALKQLLDAVPEIISVHHCLTFCISIPLFYQ